MLLFVLGFVCFHLGLALLTTLLYSLAGKMMLLAFAMLLFLGITASITALLRELRAYFCQEAAILRRLLAIQAQRGHFEQLTMLKNRQLQYFSRVKRQRLLAADNRKQLRTLYNAINQELQAVRTSLPAAAYQSMYQSLREYYKHANAEGMLTLRRQILCR